MSDGRIFTNQTALRLSLNTLVDFSITPPVAAKIHYKKPDLEEDKWDATIVENSTNGEIFVNFSDSIKFSQAGVWYLWSELEFADGRLAYGVTQKYTVRNAGVIYNS